jgi:Ca2+-binding EF-hand superfamily protein
MLTHFQKRKLIKLFSMYDADRTGYLASKDFENLAKRLAALRGWGGRSPRYRGLLAQLTSNWQELKGQADQDSNHQVDLDEWLAYYEAVLGDAQRYAKRVKTLSQLIFEAFDENGDGVISQPEWAGILRVYNVSPIYASVVFRALDINEDGVLNQLEFLDLLHDFFYSDEEASPANFMFGPY